MKTYYKKRIHELGIEIADRVLLAGEQAIGGLDLMAKESIKQANSMKRERSNYEERLGRLNVN